MFRVIYEWRVSLERKDEFQKIWSSVTDDIHQSVEGALGSFMLQSSDVPEKVLTVAKWRSKTDWQAFWGNSNPEKMQQMREIAERVAVETYDEIEDRTQS
ncbi:antibiotic biosynthesis monooxygenase family protein [Vibrio panuliri]|uniref:ABM domain-containing protein n=1 Tax=Vibrio panuliri TaxID=1381081 RepID=A0A1Q9HQS2_9VIBR|nr:antibiotic biosynthesis monooxygenase [Vibrio panuliri]KAB1458108.1 antibiotic biosynthesis monooxygenase [Vibrio panuliri]OLQ89508.1 hypothetical protein BIY20_01815 [Vibrio panuliri]OLQ93227.1 hypothetical protein BIY22_01680 [Vibrio panuliri]